MCVCVRVCMCRRVNPLWSYNGDLAEALGLIIPNTTAPVQPINSRPAWRKGVPVVSADPTPIIHLPPHVKGFVLYSI